METTIVNWGYIGRSLGALGFYLRGKRSHNFRTRTSILWFLLGSVSSPHARPCAVFSQHISQFARFCCLRSLVALSASMQLSSIYRQLRDPQKSSDSEDSDK